MRFQTGTGLEVRRVTREQTQAVDARVTTGDGPFLPQVGTHPTRVLAPLLWPGAGTPARCPVTGGHR